MGISPTGKQLTWRGNTIYQIVEGKIVEEEAKRMLWASCNNLA